MAETAFKERSASAISEKWPPHNEHISGLRCCIAVTAGIIDAIGNTTFHPPLKGSIEFCCGFSGVQIPVDRGMGQA